MQPNLCASFCRRSYRSCWPRPCFASCFLFSVVASVLLAEAVPWGGQGGVPQLFLVHNGVPTYKHTCRSAACYPCFLCLWSRLSGTPHQSLSLAGRQGCGQAPHRSSSSYCTMVSCLVSSRVATDGLGVLQLVWYFLEGRKTRLTQGLNEKKENRK